MHCEVGTSLYKPYRATKFQRESHCCVLYFFPSKTLKRSTLFKFTFLPSPPKETYMATSSNLFQMDLVIAWLIIHSVVSCVVKLCFMVSGREDNPSSVILDLVMEKEEHSKAAHVKRMYWQMDSKIWGNLGSIMPPPPLGFLVKGTRPNWDPPWEQRELTLL